MYRYYADEGKSVWKLVSDSKEALKVLAERKTPLVTALAVSEDLDTTEDPEQVRYSGDFYIDIDQKDINRAINDVQTVLAVLKEQYNVPFPRVYCSGGKGFHITMPMSVFGSTRACTNLPHTYKAMALVLAGKACAEGVDMVVYSAGKGRMWRQPNVLRKTGTYKVPITVDEAMTMTTDKYAELVSQPRDLEVKVTTKFSVEMESLYKVSKDQSQRILKSYSKVSGIRKEELDGLDFDTGCIRRLITKGDEKDGGNFNRAAMVFASFVKDKGYSQEDYLPALQEMAEKVKSKTYKTKAIRAKHLQSSIYTAINNNRIRFAKSFLFSLIDPCGKCELCNSKVAEQTDEASGVEVDHSGVRERSFSYVRGREDDARPITNFKVRVDRVYMMQEFESGRYMREKADITLIHAAGETPVTVYEEAFISKIAFAKSIMGISNLIMKGNDADLTALKEYIYSHSEEAEVIYSTDKYGITRATVPSTGQEFLVYVEPNYSISMTGMVNQYKVPRGDDVYPKLHLAEPMRSTDFLRQAFLYMFDINRPEVIAPLLGWFVATFFKVHFEAKFSNQFPLIHVYGNAGSGKTVSIEMMGYLSGLDLAGKDSMMNLSGTTMYAVKHTIASSTTVPRIFDEMNSRKVRHFEQVCELLKACWTSQAMSQGGLQRTGSTTSAKVQSIHLTGPVCTIGEQKLETPALLERIVQIHIPKDGRFEVRESGMSSREAYTKANTSKMVFSSAGKEIMMRSLQTSAAHVAEMVRNNLKTLPDTISDRPRYGRAVMLTGLDLFDECMQAIGVDLTSKVDSLKSAWLTTLTGAAQVELTDLSATEVDRVLDYLAKMVSYEDDVGTGNYHLRRGYEFMIVGDKLLVDLNKSFMLYRRHSRAAGMPPVFSTAMHMTKHLEEESYYLGSRREINGAGQKVVFQVFSIQGMIDKGVDAWYFLSEDDETSHLEVVE